MLPEMTLLEALMAIQRWVDMVPPMRRRLLKRIIDYFFLNPVEITSCPFLDGQDCLIYKDRFFGCRAYGLWTPGHYEKLAALSRQAKTHIRAQWKKLGVHLPQEVIDFQVSYCPYVELEGHGSINDGMLLNVSGTIERLSQHFSQWHHSFNQRYFSDLSFLLSSLVFGVTEAVRMKFAIVSGIVTTGDRARLDEIVGELPDLCEELT